MKTPLFLEKRLDESNGIGQDNPNKAMNAKKMPWYLRWPAAVASKVGAAVMKSKRARLASILLFAILVSIATPQLNAWVNLIYLPFFRTYPSCESICRDI